MSAALPLSVSRRGSQMSVHYSRFVAVHITVAAMAFALWRAGLFGVLPHSSPTELILVGLPCVYALRRFIAMRSSAYAAPAVFGAISLLLGSVMQFSSRGRILLRVMAFCALVVALPMLWQASLGLPRPTDLDLGKPSGSVVSYVVDEPKSVFVRLIPDGGKLPHAFSFEAGKALRLQKACAEARQHVSEVHMRPAGGDSSGNLADPGGEPHQNLADTRSSARTTDGPDFYPAPRRADPLKTETKTKPIGPRLPDDNSAGEY